MNCMKYYHKRPYIGLWNFVHLTGMDVFSIDLMVDNLTKPFTL